MASDGLNWANEHQDDIAAGAEWVGNAATDVWDEVSSWGWAENAARNRAHRK